jgi:hypothetical protein
MACFPSSHANPGGINQWPEWGSSEYSPITLRENNMLARADHAMISFGERSEEVSK